MAAQGTPETVLKGGKLDEVFGICTHAAAEGYWFYAAARVMKRSAADSAAQRLDTPAAAAPHGPTFIFLRILFCAIRLKFGAKNNIIEQMRRYRGLPDTACFQRRGFKPIRADRIFGDQRVAPASG